MFPRAARRATRAVAAAALLAVTGAGCGSGSQSDQVKSVVKTFLTAAAKGDGGTACAQLSADAVHLLESATSTSCTKVIAELGSRTSSKQRSQVEGIEPTATVHGNTATATYRGVTAARQSRTVTLEKTGGHWRISQLPSGG